MRVDQVRPIGNFVFLKVEPRKTRIGHIELPGKKTGMEVIGYCIARVVASGEGTFEQRKHDATNVGVDLTGTLREMLPVGCRVVYRDYMSTLLPLEVEDEGVYVFLNAIDIDLIVEDGVAVGAWSEIREIPESA